jgi:Ca2+-binding RTX toxin-like protein
MADLTLATRPLIPFLQGWLSSHSSYINQYAAAVGLRSTLIVGGVLQEASTILKEAEIPDGSGGTIPVIAERQADVWIDHGLFNIFSALGHQYFANDFIARKSDIIGGKAASSIQKLVSPTGNDLGYGNINLGTAILYLQRYLENPGFYLADPSQAASDPLQLQQYANDYVKLAGDLIDPSKNATWAIAALVSKQGAVDFSGFYGSSFTSKSEAEQTAYLTPFFKQGEATILRKVPDVYANDALYPPMLRGAAEGSGGPFVLDNFQTIKLILDGAYLYDGPPPSVFNVQNASLVGNTITLSGVLNGSEQWSFSQNVLTGQITIGTSTYGQVGSFSQDGLFSVSSASSGALLFGISDPDKGGSRILTLTTSGGYELSSGGEILFGSLPGSKASIDSSGITITQPPTSAGKITTVRLGDDETLSLGFGIADGSGNITNLPNRITLSLALPGANDRIETGLDGTLSYILGATGDTLVINPDSSAFLIGPTAQILRSWTAGQLGSVEQRSDGDVVLGLIAGVGGAGSALQQFLLDPAGSLTSLNGLNYTAPSDWSNVPPGTIASDATSLQNTINGLIGTTAPGGSITNSLLDVSVQSWAQTGSLQGGSVQNPPTTWVDGGRGLSFPYAYAASPVINSDGMLAVAQSYLITGNIGPARQATQSAINDFWARIDVNGGQFGLGVPVVSSVPFLQQTARWAALSGWGDTLQNIDPLVLDLDGDGIELTNWIEGNVFFDTVGDGKQHQTGWVSGGDGILSIDLNGNGKIDDISETLSVNFNAGSTPGNYADGLAALAALALPNATVFSSATSRVNVATGHLYFDDLRVWIDANQDGKTDAGELKTLSELGIVSIGLVGSGNRGETIAGNDVINRAVFTRANGSTGQIASIDFQVDAASVSVTTTAGAAIIKSEGSSNVTSYVVTDGSGHTINVSTFTLADGARPTAFYSTTGNDSFIVNSNDTQSYWLGGGTGSMTLRGGAGNDVLIINANTLQANIDGGAGFDIVKVNDTVGVTLNLAAAHVEEAIGGAGNDTFNASGMTSNAFLDGGAGNDILIGGAANDAIGGGEGDDYIDGRDGNDVLRGGNGRDIIFGGDGDDILFGEAGDDVLIGGAVSGPNGANVLEGGEGNDLLIGTGGYSIARFRGNFADYSFTRNADGTLTVTDKIENRDGTDTLKDISALDFADINQVAIVSSGSGYGFSLPVNDEIKVFGTGPYTIAASTLLANDTNFAGLAIAIRQLIDVNGNAIGRGTSGQVIGGVAALSSDGATITFTPAAGFTGVMQFKYYVQDAGGKNGMVVQQVSTGNSAELSGTVFLNTPDQPNEPLFNQQWYLSQVNVLPVWKDYTGAGVSVGVFDPTGNANLGHSDLVANAGASYKVNGNPGVEAYGNHATIVAGIIGASRNGEGVVGVAYNATISSEALAPKTYLDIANIYNWYRYDVVNNSWGTTGYFNLTGQDIPFYKTAFEQAVVYGRNGLGTSIVFAGGNSRNQGDNSNYHSDSNSRYAINVGGVNAQTDLGSLLINPAAFSTPGASILVSAPASNVVSTSELITSSTGTTFGSDYQAAKGTSFAAPIVSGIVALMLEANPLLGYRDIQKILAYSASEVDPSNATWTYNGAFNWNGGGLHVSNDYGFGMVDALAAVRLAETWTEQQTYYNEQVQGVHNEPGDGQPVPIQDGGGLSWTTNVALGDWFSIEHVDLRITLEHANLGDLKIKLTSPDGTVSILLDRPGVSVADPDGTGTTSLNYTFDSVQFWGEAITGTWTLEVTDNSLNGATGVVKDWDLYFYGEDTTFDDTYIYTNEFGSLGTGARATLVSNGGFDTLNAAAITSDSVINLTPGSISTLAGRSLVINSPSTVYNAFAGDGNDQLIGSSADNALYGGRGNDVLSGGDGRDILSGDQGNDVMTGGAGQDMFVIKKSPGDQDTIVDFKVGGIEKIAFVAFGASFSYASITVTQIGANTVLGLGDGQTVTLQNFTASQFVAGDILSFDNFRYLSQSTGTAGSDTYVWAGDNDWLALGEGGNDSLFGGTGNDRLFGGAGQDLLSGGLGDNTLTGGADADLFVISSNPGGLDTITDFTPGNLDRIAIVGFPAIRSFSDLVATQVGADAAINLGEGQALLLKNTLVSSLSINSFVFLETFPYVNQVTGTAGVEAFQWGGPAGLIAFGEGGNDIIIGYSYADALYGGDGNDILFGRGGDDRLDGGNGNDLLNGDSGNNTLTGGLGADVFAITKQANSTTIITDWKVSGGRDKLVFELFPSPLSLNPIQQGTDTVLQLADNQKVILKNTLVSAVTGDDIVLVDTWQIGGQFSGTDLADSFTAPTDDNHVIWGYGGNDQIYGGYGIDQIYGGDGADVIAGDLENTSGVGGNDVLYGGAGNDQIFGCAGDDVIRGDAGNDYIQGDQGNDILIGGTGIDQLYGGAGNDILILENEDDYFYGQAGRDTFVVLNNLGFTIGSGLKNLIMDFDASATGDKIDLSGIPTAISMADIEQVNFTYQGNNYSRVYVAGINSDQYVTLYYGTGTIPVLTASSFIFGSGSGLRSMGSTDGADEPLPSISNEFLNSVVPELSWSSGIAIPDGMEYYSRDSGQPIVITAENGFGGSAEIANLDVVAATAANRLADALASFSAQSNGSIDASGPTYYQVRQDVPILAPALV